MKTLFVGEKVSETVVKVWCDILNLGEQDKSTTSPLRLYMYRDGQESADIKFSDVKLVFVPYTATGRPFLVCVQPAAKKIEAMHAMKPKSVAYQFSLAPCKIMIDERLKEKIPAIAQLNWLDAQEYVPTNNLGERMDTGIHVMYFMDSYKGSRRGYTCSLSSDARLKKFVGRACCRILSSDLNKLKEKMKEEALQLAGRQCKPGPSGTNSSPPTDSSGNALTIKNIKEYMRRSKDDLEIMVDTEWVEVTMKGIKSLNPRGKVMDMVIDAIGIRNCLHNPEFLYLPTFVKNLDPNKQESIYKQYVKMTYIPENVNQFKKVFMPFAVENHWFAAVVDLEKKKTFILDSLHNKKAHSSYTAIVRKAAHNVEALIRREHGLYRMQGMSTFQVEFAAVPQQTNGHDCGLFVLKWIEAVNEQSLWTRDDYYKSLNEYRDCKILELLNWDVNKKKVF